MNILNQILEEKKAYVSKKERLVPKALLEESIHFNAPTISLKEYLLREDKSGIIAEFKRKSPSKGNINAYAEVENITLGYMQAGASALSVLTDAKHFGGSDNDLEIARKLNYCPILRKEFIVGEYQIIEARSIGADAILLIANALSNEQIRDFSRLAASLELEILLELHHENEIDKIPDTEVLIGVNNRNLETFEVDLNNSIKMKPLLPSNAVLVAESGIHHPEDVAKLKSHGFHGFLIGERFMATANPGKACRSFIEAIPELKTNTHA